MYIIRNKSIYKIEILYPSKRGTSVWAKCENIKKKKLVSLMKIYETYNEAEKVLEKMKKKKVKKNVMHQNNEVSNY